MELTSASTAIRQKDKLEFICMTEAFWLVAGDKKFTYRKLMETTLVSEIFYHKIVELENKVFDFFKLRVVLLSQPLYDRSVPQILWAVGVVEKFHSWLVQNNFTANYENRSLTISISETGPMDRTIKSISTTAGGPPKFGRKLLSWGSLET